MKEDNLPLRFFFWRKTGDRDDVNKLVSTLAYQIAEKIPLAKKGMVEILRLKNDQGQLTVLSDGLSKTSLASPSLALLPPTTRNRNSRGQFLTEPSTDLRYLSSVSVRIFVFSIPGY